MSFGRLFVGNVSYNLDEAALTAELLALGIDAKNLRIVRDRESSLPKGFGFFDVEADKVEETINVANNAFIGGRPLRVAMASKQPDDKHPAPPSRSKQQPIPREDKRRPREFAEDDDQRSRRRR